MSFAEKIQRESALVYDIRSLLGAEEEEEIFTIVQVNKAAHQAFKQALKSDGAIPFEQFGTVLHRGQGEPSEELKAELRRKYSMYEE